jgi:hypothetical protein
MCVADHSLPVQQRDDDVGPVVESAAKPAKSIAARVLTWDEICGGPDAVGKLRRRDLGVVASFQSGAVARTEGFLSPVDFVALWTDLQKMYLT